MQSAGVGGFSDMPNLLRFLSELLTPHNSGQIPQTVALYYTPAKDQKT
jgi:hypothetical protein